MRVLVFFALFFRSLMPSAPSIQDVLERHNRYQDSMVQAFETQLRAIVLRAQGKVASELQAKLSITDGAIDGIAQNQRVLRGVNDMFMRAMREAGYDRLVDAFAGQFRGTLPFLDEIIQQLAKETGQEWNGAAFGREENNLLASAQLSAVSSIDQALQSAAGAAMTRGLMGVGGLKFSSLVDTLSQRIEASIGQARTIADTSMSTFYRTASDRAFQIVAKDLPQQELRYKYSGPDDKLTRPFCDHLVRSGKSYTREEIGKMNNGQLPNVFVTGGGWNCRHTWILDADAITGELVAASALVTPSDHAIAPAVHIANEAISRVHRLPASAGKIEVVSDRGMFEGGKFQWDLASGQPLPMRLNPLNDHLELTSVLETGHFIDFAAIGKKGNFASVVDPMLEDWRQAVDSTRAVQTLIDMRSSGSIPYRGRDGQVRNVNVRERMRYLLQPYELFSRSYAQFIASESKDETLLRQIAGFTSPKNPSSIVPIYWSDDDFDAIAEAFRKLILELGWRNK